MRSLPNTDACSAAAMHEPVLVGLQPGKNQSGPRCSTGTPSSAGELLGAVRKASTTSAGSGPRSSVRSATIRRVGEGEGGSGVGSAVGSPSTGPATTSSRSRRSSVPVAISPSVEKSIQSGAVRLPITPFVGL